MPGTDRKVMPETMPNKSGGESRGILAPVADPLGKGLNAGLSPIGAGVGQVTGPVAEGAGNVSKPLLETLGISDKGEEKEKAAQKADRIGGNEQTGQNPLGL